MIVSFVWLLVILVAEGYDNTHSITSLAPSIVLFGLENNFEI